MNRQIKFRAWDKRTLKMRPIFQILWNEKGEVNAINADPTHLDDIVLMQFTGLKDAKGREIYEGDVVKNDQWNPEVYKIMFDTGAFCMSRSDSNTIVDIKYINGFEVIGNIYEHPSLTTKGDEK